MLRYIICRPVLNPVLKIYLMPIRCYKPGMIKTILDMVMASNGYVKSSWWRHQMETFSTLLALCEENSPVTSELTHKGQWHEALIFYLICAWAKGWANHRYARDLRRHRAHYDVTVKFQAFCLSYVHAWHPRLWGYLSTFWNQRHGSMRNDMNRRI